ncbi:hypothetical protein OTK49_28430 [Vibrio coralliirubri]|uniref:hypothetical protein n=1 Tax=Vibrio coralliirubri TaxID=1516159 RepID=UPI0022845B5E|nr:hypothetical protein [Vibrio coralliirubri]MCY9866471.1 hypothetical protein [Vibrio coralliirubri]
MKFVAFPSSFTTAAQAIEANSLKITESNIDAISNLFEDMYSNAYFDLIEIMGVLMPNKDMIAGTIFRHEDKDYFVSLNLIHLLNDEQIEDFVDTYFSFTDVMGDFIRGEFGDEVREQLGDSLTQNFCEVAI